MDKPHTDPASVAVERRETLEQYGDRIAAATRKKMLDALDDDVIACLTKSHVAEPCTADEAWQDLIEKDDRTSPEDQPDMALITRKELADYMAGAAALQSDRDALVGPPAMVRAPFAVGDSVTHVPTGVRGKIDHEVEGWWAVRCAFDDSIVISRPSRLALNQAGDA